MSLRGSLKRTLERLMPARMADTADPEVKQALDNSALIAAQVRQWALETELYRRRPHSRHHPRPSA